MIFSVFIGFNPTMAIHCYQCNSTTAEGCMTGNCETNGTCIKTNPTVFGVQITVKDCSPNGIHNIGCHPYTDPKSQSIMNVCACMKKDYCNNSPVSHLSFGNIVLGFIFIIVGYFLAL